MKLVRYGESGRERPAILDEEGLVRDISEHVYDIGSATLVPQLITHLSSLNLASLPRVTGNMRLGPCVGGVGKIVCSGLNYTDHAAEAAMGVPKEPILFMKATSAIAGPHDDLCLPPHARKVDWEVELAVVIGLRAKCVSPAEALQHVAGYCVLNDVSERAFQLEGTGQWTKGKSLDGFAPLGPWLVTTDEVSDPQNLDLWLTVNGLVQQKGNTAAMVFAVDQLISYVSRFMTLDPGDVIATGTPAGVGMGQRPPRYLQVGDVMTAGISGLGQQKCVCIGGS